MFYSFIFQFVKFYNFIYTLYLEISRIYIKLKGYIRDIHTYTYK